MPNDSVDTPKTHGDKPQHDSPSSTVDVEELERDVRDVLTDCPHETASPGSGVMESEEWKLETQDGTVVLYWERTWAGALGGYSGVLNPYFEYESRIRNDDTGGEFHITDRTNHDHWCNSNAG